LRDKGKVCYSAAGLRDASSVPFPELLHRELEASNITGHGLKRAFTEEFPLLLSPTNPPQARAWVIDHDVIWVLTTTGIAGA